MSFARPRSSRSERPGRNVAGNALWIYRYGMGYCTSAPIGYRVPTVLVRLATDDGEVAFRARWKRSPLELQRRILFRLREGKPLWFEDERGRDLCFKPERVWGAMVIGR